MWCWEGCDGREGCGVGSMLTSSFVGNVLYM